MASLLDDAPRAGRRAGHVDVDGLRVKVSIQGEGPTLLLINGIGANVAMWAPFERALPGVRTVAFDTPGAGDSPPLRTAPSMRRLAGVVARLLDELELERVDVLGFSLGGALAQELAHRAPHRVGRLILAATSCGVGSVPGRPAALAIIATPLRYYSRPYFEQVAPTLMGGERWRDRAFVREQADARISHPPTLRGYYWQLAAASTWSSLPWLHTLPQPTLVLTGDQDPLVCPVNSRLLARRIPHARLHVMRGGGHLCLLDHADDTGRVVARFLQEAP
jgi:poly(3-hydroxyoctanoate) depolymerase